MKEHFRQSMAWLHTWTGLLAGWVLFFVFVTGSAAYFHAEITRWMQPELPLRPAFSREVPVAVMLEHALDFLARQPEADREWRIVLPQSGARVGCGVQCGGPLRGYPSDLTVSWAGNTERLDAATGAPLPPLPRGRDTAGGALFRDMHYQLHYLERGAFVVAVATLLALVAIVTGVIIHKRIFRDFFVFRPGGGTRAWLDGHNVAAVMALPFFVMITYSGLAYQGGDLIPAALMAAPEPAREVALVWDDPPLARRPALPMAALVDAAGRVLGADEIGMVSLHHSAEHGALMTFSRLWGTEWPLVSRHGSEVNFSAETGELLDIPMGFGQQPAWKALWFFTITHVAWFAGAGLRWLLFFSGLLGGAMIATGLVLWTVKRRARHAREGGAPSFGLRLVERLNVGVLAGLPVGIAAYFWANRLLPVSLDGRADWEADCLFFAWAWVALYALWRAPAGKAWAECLGLAAAAFGLVPLLNALTTDKHLGSTMARGDWVLAGVDLTMLACAAAFAAMAWKAGAGGAREGGA
ncbi:MAG: PepSY domain-containing protein [Azoarcus sp.]|jgi:uncharacterized iron-regulated membrane protein|nr:PepSY domain-containing protein [Azoarcus sp.]